jgi:hypothetical protein
MPTYVEVAADAEFGRLFVQPILRALPTVFEHLLYKMDAASKPSVDSVRTIVECLFAHFQIAMEKVVRQTERLKRPSTVRLLSSMFEVIGETLRPLDYCLQLQPWARTPAVITVKAFCSLAAYVLVRLQGDKDSVAIPTIGTGPASISEDPTLNYALTSLRTAIGKWQVWETESGVYELRGPGSIRTLRTDLGTLAEERDAFRDVLMKFLDGVQRLPSFAALWMQE